MPTELICAIAAVVVWGGAGLLAMLITDKKVSKEDREAEAKGYFRKRDTPPNSSGSDPPPSA